MKTHLVSLYRQRFGTDPAAVVDLRADGSNRMLFRLLADDGSSVVGVFGPDPDENAAFLSFSRSFRSVGLPVPEIHAADETHGVYLEEDLGDTTLFDALSAARSDRSLHNRSSHDRSPHDRSHRDISAGGSVMSGSDFPDSMVSAYESVVELLPAVQVSGGRVIDYSAAYPASEFDRASMMWDLNYFKYHFLKLAGIPFNEARLESDFARLCDLLLTADRSHFLYRDFQSRNIMLRDGRPWLIDYQGGRRGALQYDIASLLYDAKADLPQALRDELLSRYMAALGRHVSVPSGFRELYRGFVLIRILQAMGAYGYRGFFERKEHFLASVPYAVTNLERLAAAGLPVELPELSRVIAAIATADFSRLLNADAAADAPAISAGGSAIIAGGSAISAGGGSGAVYAATRQFAVGLAEGAAQAALHGDAAGTVREVALRVRITSFSFKRGYPADVSGHGGGFVFDCRALHNPGRYPEYRTLTGRDHEVREFLEHEEDLSSFWENVEHLADQAIATYIDRGFSDLAIAFGCTGGQHRSVYCAERLASHVASRFPGVRIELEHREAATWPAAT